MNDQARGKDLLDAVRRALEIAPGALLLGDRDGTVLFQNSMARRILTAHDGLRLAGSRLAAHGEEDTQLIRAAWGRALGEPPATAPRAQLLQVERRSQRPAYQLAFVGLNGTSLPDTHPPEVPVIAVQMFDPATLGSFSANCLGELYGMTSAESEVAVAIAQGRDLAGLARDSKRAIGTVRTLLKRAMAKTGTSRQNMLAALLWQGAAGAMARYDETGTRARRKTRTRVT